MPHHQVKQLTRFGLERFKHVAQFNDPGFNNCGDGVFFTVEGSIDLSDAKGSDLSNLGHTRSNVFGLLSLVGLALFADRVSRRTLIGAARIIAVAPMILLAVQNGGVAATAIVLAATTQTSLNVAAPTLFLYAPELYPAQLRALDAGFASACTRAMIIVVPPLVGLVLQHFGPTGVFAVLGVVLVASGAVAWIGTVDTRERVFDADLDT